MDPEELAAIRLALKSRVLSRYPGTRISLKVRRGRVTDPILIVSINASPIDFEAHIRMGNSMSNRFDMAFTTLRDEGWLQVNKSELARDWLKPARCFLEETVESANTGNTEDLDTKWVVSIRIGRPDKPYTRVVP